MRIFINRIAELIIKHLDGDLTDPEQAELNVWLEQSEKERAFFNQVTDKEYITAQLEQLYSYDKEAGWKKLSEQYHFSEPAVIKMKPSVNWKKLSIAASILLVIGLGSYLLFFDKSKQPVEIAKTTEERFKNDVNPGGFKARLTLADGRTIILDSAAIGELTKQGSTAIINKDGQLVYQTNGKSTEVLYNTLSTAKGETYATVLADGSKVWLNSASSIKYPVAFIGNKRDVEITGEAYFEVAKDKAKPFHVKVNDIDVEVLGTHFNINSYADEVAIKTTLLEGSVRVTKSNKEVIIKPGQQAQVADEIKINSNVDVDQVMAWKNGLFDFSSANLETVMRQLARWYDIEIIYKDKLDVNFSGEMRRNTKLSEMLRAIELTANVHFSIDGNKVTVMK